MASKIFAPVFLAGAAAAAAILFAPAAGATTSASCDDNGVASVCTRAGHAAIVATPNTDQDSSIFGQGGNPFGSGPTPPIFALD